MGKLRWNSAVRPGMHCAFCREAVHSWRARYVCSVGGLWVVAWRWCLSVLSPHSLISFGDWYRHFVFCPSPRSLVWWSLSHLFLSAVLSPLVLAMYFHPVLLYVAPLSIPHETPPQWCSHHPFSVALPVTPQLPPPMSHRPPRISSATPGNQRPGNSPTLPPNTRPHHHDIPNQHILSPTSLASTRTPDPTGPSSWSHKNRRPLRLSAEVKPAAVRGLSDDPTCMVYHTVPGVEKHQLPAIPDEVEDEGVSPCPVR